MVTHIYELKKREKKGIAAARHSTIIIKKKKKRRKKKIRPYRESYPHAQHPSDLKSIVQTTRPPRLLRTLFKASHILLAEYALICAACYNTLV